MRRSLLSLVVALCSLFTVGSVKAQTIHFRSGDVVINDATRNLDIKFTSEELVNGFAYRFLTFSSIPNENELKAMESAGVRLLEYVPKNTYLARLSVSVESGQLQQLNVVSVLAFGVEHKLSAELQSLMFKPSKPNAYQEVYFKVFDGEVGVSENFKGHVSSFDRSTGLGHASMKVKDIRPFAASSNVKYVEVEPPVGEPESDDGRNLHCVNVIDPDYFGGRNYDGSGVSVAVNDDGFVGPHIDFKGRVEQSEVDGDFTGTHGDGVAGVVGAAGNLNPRYRGMATGSRMHIRQYSSSLPGTVDLLEDSNVVIFNSSYSNGCNDGYTLTTWQVDQQQFDHSALMQVFSAGNSNGQDCDYGAGDQWGNITGGHKMAKNSIAVANLSEVDEIVESSSRGPASDGRIKPDIAAHGSDQVSNDPDNSYGAFGGTSAAAPGIAGVLAQLYQAHREINLSEAPAALMKCLLLNTATDLGNAGPDFIFGYGKVNAYHALRALEEGRYTTGTVSQGETISIPFQVPAGVKLAKVMVYWADEEASLVSATALVADMDITVEDPSSNVHQPYVLDPTPDPVLLNTPATQGADHLNNMEQVPLFNPIPGNYQLNVSGTEMPFGAATFFVCYEFLTDEVDLTYPIGGEGWEPGATERVHWNAYGTSEDFLVEMSVDNGVNWQSFGTLSGTARFTEVTVPNTVSGQAKVRITRGVFSDESDTTFSVIGVPQNLDFTNVCLATPVYNVRFEWDLVDGATAYDVFVLGAMYMDSLTTTSDTFFDLPLPEDEVSWLSVRARNNDGAVGERAVAVPFGWNQGEQVPCFLVCGGAGDAGVTLIQSPSPIGFQCSTSSTEVSVVLENLGADPQSGFEVGFMLDGQTVTETFAGTVPAGGQVNYTFNQQAQAPSSSGVYQLKVWTNLGSDITSCNDSVVQEIHFEESVPMMPLAEDFEGNDFPTAGSLIFNEDDDMTWELVEVTGSDGAQTQAMFVENYFYNSSGPNQDIYRLPLLDIENALTSALTFDVAYRPYQTAGYEDTLRIDVSEDCGLTFQTVYQKNRPQLSTGSATGSAFYPENANHWRKDSIDLSAYAGGRILVQFVNMNGYGNNLFIDNINFNGSFVGISDVSEVELKTYPVPTSNTLTVESDRPMALDATVRLYDAVGRTLLVENWGGNAFRRVVDMSGLSPGQYLLDISSEGFQRTIKVAKM